LSQRAIIHELENSPELVLALELPRIPASNAFTRILRSATSLKKMVCPPKRPAKRIE
jgi:hypothetical protein